MTRIQDINPEALAAEVHGWLTAYRWRLDMAISLHGGDTRYPPTTWQTSDAGRAVHQVAVYATTGIPPEYRKELLPEYLQTIGEAVWQAPHPGVYQMVPFPWDSGAGEPTTDLDVVLVAAVGREWLDEGRPVTQLMVACLAGLDLGALRNLISAGELAADARDEDDKRVRLIEASEAIRFLTSRGVRGLFLSRILDAAKRRAGRPTDGGQLIVDAGLREYHSVAHDDLTTLVSKGLVVNTMPDGSPVDPKYRVPV